MTILMKKCQGNKLTRDCFTFKSKATSYKVKNGLLKMAFSDEPISNKIF